MFVKEAIPSSFDQYVSRICSALFSDVKSSQVGGMTMYQSEERL